jgi:hypothetical protein
MPFHALVNLGLPGLMLMALCYYVDYGKGSHQQDGKADIAAL